MKIAPNEITPICPWRNPSRDLAILFPFATEPVTETRILSGALVSIQKQLGRPMRADENPLRIYRVAHGANLGSVLVHRVKGEHGAIEVVTGIKHDAVRGVLIQSQREPEVVARAITNSGWLAAFNGKRASSEFRVGNDLPDVPNEARPSAQAIADAVRSQLILFSFAENAEATQHHVHH